MKFQRKVSNIAYLMYLSNGADSSSRRDTDLVCLAAT